MGKDWDNPDTFPLRDRGERLTGSGNPTVSRGFANNVHIDNSKRAREGFIAFLREVMTEALRVLRPGGHALVWALPRTSHWTATALEDAGFEVRDNIYHLYSPESKIASFYSTLSQEQRNLFEQILDSQDTPSKLLHCFGSGFPKSHNISVAIDKHLNAEREVIGKYDSRSAYDGHDRPSHAAIRPDNISTTKGYGQVDITAPATPEAAQYAGYGTALKPSCEEWILCRKPLAESSIAAQVLATGTGGLNIAQCRVGLNGEKQPTGSGDRRNSSTYAQDEYTRNHMHNGGNTTPTQGRFPSHLLLSHSVFCQPTSCEPDLCPIAELDRQSGVRKSGVPTAGKSPSTLNAYGQYEKRSLVGGGDTGFASRYFTNFPPDDYTPFLYQSKASRAERNAGLLLDSSEIVMIQLSHNSQTGGIEWEKQGQRARLQVDTAQSRPRVIGVSGTTTNDVQEWNTFLFGNDTMEPSLKECKFTIETKTNSITTSKTLNWLIRSLTNGSIVDVNSEMVNGGNHAASVKSSIQSVTIMSESMVSLPGVGNVPARTPLTISISEKLEHNNIDFGTMKAGGSGKPVNGTGLPLPRANVHPCVKPLALMRWLIRLITPPDGIVLDPFCGSGSTCVAAIQEGKHFIGIEQSSEYCDIANARIEYARTHEPDERVQVATKKVKGNKGFQGYDGQHTINDYGKYEHRSATNPADQDGMEEVEDWECAPDCPIRILGEQSGERKSAYPGNPEKAAQQSHKHYEDIPTKIYGDGLSQRVGRLTSDTGTAARYFQQFPPDSLFAECDEVEVGA